MTKTRITKKLVALATTILMLTAMLLPVSASPGTGSITIRKHAGTSMAAALPNNTGAAVAVPAGYTPLGGAGFMLYQIPNANLTALIDGAGTIKTIASHAIDTTGVTPTSGVPTITWTYSDGTTYTATAVALPWVSEQITAAGTGLAVFSGTVIPGAPGAAGTIPDGHYILVETTTPAGHLTGTPSLVQLPMKNGAVSNYQVHVYPKNITSDGLMEKEVEGAQRPVSYDDVVPFSLKAKFINAAGVSSAADLRNTASPSGNPADYGTAKIEERFNTYFVNDGINSNIQVRWTNAANDFIGAVLSEGLHYTVARTPATAVAGEIVAVQLTPAGIDAAILSGAAGFGFTISAQFKGLPSAGVGAPVSISNSMVADIRKAGDTTTPPPPPEVIHVPTISVTARKVDDSVVPVTLAGATFKIATVGVNPQPADFVKGAGGIDLTVTTDATGVFSFSNLPNYSNLTGAKYYLIETVTPAGYTGNAIIAVEWANKAIYQGTNPGFFNGAGNWLSGINLVRDAGDIVNTTDGTTLHEPGFSLPLTGGAGTMMFTAIGVLVMLGATVVYLRGKKKNI